MKTIVRDLLIRKYIDTDIAKFNNSDVKIVLENLKQNILKMPVIDRPSGEWTDIYQLSTDGRMTRMSAQCKNCGEKTIFWDKTPNFCPECGARMKGADNE